MCFIRDNIAVLAIFALGAAYAWVFGGTRGEMMVDFAPWLWFVVAETMLCFPQRRKDENSYMARERVWEDLKRDPLTWCVVIFIALLIIPFVNEGLCPICDSDAIARGVNPKPLVAFLPFCVNSAQHLTVFLWFGPILTAMLSVKHALNKEGKIKLVQLFVWNGVALAALGYIQQLFEAPGPLWIDMGGNAGTYFSTFGYPNMAGDMFVILFCMAMGLWRNQVEACDRELANQKTRRISKHRLFWMKHHDLIPAVLFFMAAMSTLSRATIILVSLAAVVLCVHAIVSFLHKMKKAKRVRTLAIIGGVLIFVGFAFALFMPDDMQREIDTLSTGAVLDRVTGRGQYHTRVAFEIWKDYRMFGCGGWGYKHFCIPKMTDEELAQLQAVGGINVHNDYLQFMAEHGLAGFGLLVAIVILLLVPVGRIWRAYAASIRFAPPHKQPPQPRTFFVFPAAAFSLLLAAICTFIHSFGDCPLRSPAVMILFFTNLAAVDGFLPYLQKRKD